MRTAVNLRVACDHEVRLRAVAAVLDGGCELVRRVAEELGVARRSVRRWVQKHKQGALEATPPGPRPRVLDREMRQGVIALLVALGPLANVNSVRAVFTTVPYRMITCIKRRMARVGRRREGRQERKLTWFRPGSVWAMDFTKPKAKLPGGNRCLLMVRDLASGMRLAAVACKGEQARVVIETLRTLFAAHGQPLAMKFDNGPGFKAHATTAMLEESGVQQLASPVYTPQYNGSIERSLGWDKVRIAYIAELAGHPGIWTAADIERALLQANDTLRPWGATKPTPRQAFDARQPITDEERHAFKQTVSERIQELLTTQTCVDPVTSGPRTRSAALGGSETGVSMWRRTATGSCSRGLERG